MLKMNEEVKDLQDKLQDHEKRIAALEQLVGDKKTEAQLFGNEGMNIEKLASKIGIPSDRLNEVFDIEGNILTVIKYIGDKDRDKTQNISLLTMLGYKYFFQQEDVLSQEIRRNVAENNIALNNFGTYLNELSPSLLRKKGELRSPKTAYRLTVLGEAKAKELIKNIFGLS